MAALNITAVVLVTPIKENTYRRFSSLSRITTEKFSIDVRWKERQVVVDKTLIIPFENVAYFVNEYVDCEE